MSTMNQMSLNVKRMMVISAKRWLHDQGLGIHAVVDKLVAVYRIDLEDAKMLVVDAMVAGYLKR